MPTPERIRGGILSVFHGSTLVAVYIKPPLIIRGNGRTRYGISAHTARKWYHFSRYYRPSHQKTDHSLSILRKTRVFVTAFG